MGRNSLRKEKRFCEAKGCLWSRMRFEMEITNWVDHTRELRGINLDR
jgi:hypothetical protein